MKAKVISFAALASIVSAAPTARSTGPFGTGVMYLNGEQMNLNTPTATHGPCTVDDDVETCAGKIAATWTLPGNVTSTESLLTWRGTCFYGLNGDGQSVGCQISLPYTANFHDCKLQEPPVLTQLSKNGAFDCNSGGTCQYQMAFGTVSTNTTTMGYKVASQLSASASIGIVSTSLQVSADFSQNWSDTQTATATETRTYNLNPGDICNPTTIQFRTDCQTNIQSTYNGTFNNIIYPTIKPYGDVVVLQLDPDDRQIGTQLPFHLCSSNGNQQMIGDVSFEGTGKEQICAAMQTGGTVPVDVGALSGLGPWALQGCMFD